MNKYTALDVCYLRPSRTIETILLEKGDNKRIIYVYNYDGIHFSVFNFITDILEFFNNEIEADISFETDEELNHYLQNLDLETLYTASNILI